MKFTTKEVLIFSTTVLAALPWKVKSPHLLQVKRKMQIKCIDFLHASVYCNSLTYLLLQFLVPIKYSLKKYRFV